MKVHVIGGSGFIGTYLVERLTRRPELEVTILDNRPSAVFPHLVRLVDIRDYDALEAAIEPHAILVHLAAEHRDDVTPRSLYDEVNVGGARNLCAAAVNKGCTKIIFTSSVAVYGAAEIDTDEEGRIAPFNDYGRTKFEAEQIFDAWQAGSADRTLVTVRPTVVFGELNRGNVYNLLAQIYWGRFVMVGSGRNRKSLAYVRNVAAFLEFCLDLGTGRHLFNYVDKPDFEMNELVRLVTELLGRRFRPWLRVPYAFGLAAGAGFDLAARVTGRKFPISAIRVRKFCLNSVYATAVDGSGFQRPYSLEEAIRATVRREFLEPHADRPLFYTE